MDNARASKIEESKIAQGVHPKYRITAPGPATLHGVNEARHYDSKGEEGEQLHALCDRTGHNRHGGCYKHHLEEKVRRRCVGGRLIGPGDAVAGDRAQHVIAAVHDGVTAHHVHGAGHSEQRDVLGEDLDGVLAPDEARLQHGKARRHPHNESTAHQEVKGVQCVLQLKNFVLHD